MIKKKTIDDHTNGAPQFLIDLFKSLKTKISTFDKVEEKVTAPYIGYYYTEPLKKPKLFVEIHIQKRNQKIVLHLRPVEYIDPLSKIFEYHYVPKWPLRRGIDIVNQQDIDYCIPFIKKSYNDVA